MDRQFFPGGGFGPGPFHPPFFIPRRRFIPFFFISPFVFPFPFRENDERSGMHHIQHHVKEGETYDTLAQMYNCPRPILEAMNPHIPHPYALAPGMVVHVPRLDKMVCHRMYMEQEVYDGVAAHPGYGASMAMPYMGTAPIYPGL